MCKTCQVEKRPFCRPKTDIENAQRKGKNINFTALHIVSGAFPFGIENDFLIRANLIKSKFYC